MDEQLMFKTASEYNLAIKMFQIIDDAVKEKTGSTVSDALLSEAIYGRKKKVVFAQNFAHNIGQTISGIKKVVKFLLKSGKPVVIIPAMVAAIYGAYAGTSRIVNYVRELLGLDPNGKGNTPDPYENIEEPYKFEDNKANRSREVRPGWYEPESSGQQWFQDTEKNKFWNAGEALGIPSQFGIEPGFMVSGPSKPSKFNDTIQELKTNNQLAMASNKEKLIVTAQGVGNFTSESIAPIQNMKLNPDVAGWIQPQGFEQFMSQSVGPWRPEGVGEWAASPSQQSAFYDPSGKLGRDKPVEWKPIGYGDNFLTPEESFAGKIPYMKEKYEAHRSLAPKQIAEGAVWQFRNIDLRQKEGKLTPEHAALMREMVTKSIQMNDPILAAQVEQAIQNADMSGAVSIPNTTSVDRMSPNLVSNEYMMQDPFQRHPEYQKNMENYMNAIGEYQESPLYQGAVQQSPELSNPYGAKLISPTTAIL